MRRKMPTPKKTKNDCPIRVYDDLAYDKPVRLCCFSGCNHVLNKGEERFCPCHSTPPDTTEGEKDFRTLLNEELGYVSGIFMSQGDTRAGDIVMPTRELQEIADRIELYAFSLLSSQREALREEVEGILKARLKYCEEQNGREYCKNCGLCPEDLQAIKEK
jgi:hypothetical protein